MIWFMLLEFYMFTRGEERDGRSIGAVLKRVRKSGQNSRSPFGPLGNLLSESATGTVPVFSIVSSRFFCSRAARSASSSSSSMGSVIGMEVMALPISWVSSCCSRSCSL